MKKEKSSVKKPFYKKWWFWVIIVLVVLSVGIGSKGDDETGKETTLSVETTKDLTTTESHYDETLVFELIAGEQGDYGKMITYNKGTEFEENFYAYYVPAGVYRVTNVGKYMSQINVYSDELSKTEEGWEEPAEVFSVKLLDVSKSDYIEVKEGQHIEIAEPSNFKLEKQ